jgi:large subunit ribosomal protein L16
MFFPTKFKYKKQQKGKSFLKINSQINSINKNFNFIGLKTLNAGRLTTNQLKTLRQSILKIIKKKGRLNLYVFPQTPITKKPIEIRMGKGKGNVDHWVAKIKAGTVLCSINSLSNVLAFNALKYAQIKIPFKTKIISY